MENKDFLFDVILVGFICCSFWFVIGTIFGLFGYLGYVAKSVNLKYALDFVLGCLCVLSTIFSVLYLRFIYYFLI
jgi:hypothetical protein